MFAIFKDQEFKETTISSYLSRSCSNQKEQPSHLQRRFKPEIMTYLYYFHLPRLEFT